MLLYFLFSSNDESVSCQVPVDIIPYEDLVIGKFLGAGAEGAVYAASYLEAPVAVKGLGHRIHEIEMNLHAGITFWSSWVSGVYWAHDWLVILLALQLSSLMWEMSPVRVPLSKVEMQGSYR